MILTRYASLAAADLHLDAADLSAIAAAIKQTGAGSGPPSPREA